jgi:hypothetical protein
LARFRPAPGCSNERTCCTSWTFIDGVSFSELN